MSNTAPQIFFDASGLIKRYSSERGANLVDEIFNLSPTERMACSYLGILEVISILIRQRNDKRLPRPVFEQAMAEFEAEIANNSLFTSRWWFNPLPERDQPGSLRPLASAKLH